MTNYAHEVRKIFDLPRHKVRALSDGTTCRIEVASDTKVTLKDGCRGYRREWTVLCHGDINEFNFKNILTALTIRNIGIRYEAQL